MKDRLGRLEDEISIARKEEQNDYEQLKRQMFNLRDDMSKQKPDFKLQDKPDLDDTMAKGLDSRLTNIEKEREVLEKQILSLIMKIDQKVDQIEGTVCYGNSVVDSGLSEPKYWFN